MPKLDKTHLPDVRLAVSVYRRWRIVLGDRISDEIRIAPQIRLASSSDLYRFWDRCVPSRFRKERNARFRKETKPFRRDASRAPFVSRALLVFLSSDFSSLQTQHGAPLLLAFPLQNLRYLSHGFTSREKCYGAADGEDNFCKGKDKERGAQDPSPPYKTHKGVSMEYLILVAVVSMMALYALIIAGCLKQPEW